MKKHGFLPVGAQVKIDYSIHGGLLIAAGIMGMFDNLICNIIEVLLLALVVACYIVPYVYKCQESDEMADANMKEAEAYSLTVAELVLMLIAIVIVILPNDITNAIDWKIVLREGVFIFVGLLKVLTGLTFKQLEEEEE